MTKGERENLIEWLIAGKGYSPQFFEKRTDEEIKKMYEEMLVKG